MDASLQELNQKIDLLTAQVTYLSEQAQSAERQRLERTELVRDITPLANQAFELAIEQLEEIQEYIDLDDLLRLLKRLLRNGRNLEKMLDQLESLADLIETLSPLADDAFGKAVDIMAGLEAKGYFTFARGGMNLIDTVVTSFSEEELNRMGDFTHRTLVDVKKEMGRPVDVSYFGLIKQLRDPAFRRGLTLTLRMMQGIGTQAVNPATQS
ncbi:MAG: hypothetical protein A2029_09500 [Chloroflexi bacterium RBG_19FT_COMBO_47_9]|nr:MAG: hypothetical protein A2029_09500 [Chloroflexi bacterium RBG_19FT_COMBO_47_9]